MSYARYGALRVLPGGMGLLVDNPGSFGALPSTDWAGQASARSFTPAASMLLGAAVDNGGVQAAAAEAASMEQEAQRVINHPLAQSLQAKIAAAESAINSATEALYQKVLNATGQYGSSNPLDNWLTAGAFKTLLDGAGPWASGVVAAYKAYTKNVGAQLDVVNTAIAADQSAAIAQTKAATAKTVDLTAGTLQHAAVAQKAATDITVQTYGEQIQQNKLETAVGIGKVMKPILIGAAVLLPVGAIAFFMLKKKKGAKALKGYRRHRRSRR